MSQSKKVPSYRLHKASGQAIVTLGGRMIYLGVYGSPESHAKYARTVAEWQVAAAVSTEPTNDLTVTECLARYLAYAEGIRCRDADGNLTQHYQRIRLAMRLLREMYGDTPANRFRSLALQAVRRNMIERGWRHRHINCCTGCIKTAFRWLVSQELVDPAVVHALDAVEPLTIRRPEGAVLSKDVRPIPDADIEPVIAELPWPLCDVARIQLWTGARAGEILQMRPMDVDTTGDVWTFRPQHHKTETLGKDRLIMIGSQAQDVLRPYLDRAPEAFCFCPREAVEKRLTELGHRIMFRKSRRPGDRYEVNQYAHRLRAACRRAGVKPWTSHQLRHTAATRVRARFGPDAAKAVLGHSSLRTTEIYAELDMGAARKAMGAMG